MSETPATEHLDSDGDGSPRSTSSVLVMLGVLVALPLLVVVLLLVLSGSGGGSDNLNSVVSGDRVQSVELTNGRVLFGSLEEGDGDWLVLRDAYFLRQTADSESADDAEEGNTELVPITAEQGGDGDVVLNAREVVAFQNLDTDSPIGRQIKDATD